MSLIDYRPSSILCTQKCFKRLDINNILFEKLTFDVFLTMSEYIKIWFSDLTDYIGMCRLRYKFWIRFRFYLQNICRSTYRSQIRHRLVHKIRTNYVSPLFHLLILGVAWYCRQSMHTSLCEEPDRSPHCWIIRNLPSGGWCFKSLWRFFVASYGVVFW